ncbi:efflux RND transporter periplasmic adaptor subunit [Legionella dresdenensis]|uniref:Efflux RND transporter periplasmic adaptor subunit n=1 Tax=Legionella dresdenensis TaxID=450200 RepID=A0ABV8CFH2_9GAMM
MPKLSPRIILPVVAGACLVFAVVSAITMEPDESSLAPPQPPLSAPMVNGKDMIIVAGTGLVEAASENIQIGSHLSGVVEQVFVKVGSQVKKGEPLFQLDIKSAQAECSLRRAQVEVAKARLQDAQSQLGFYENVRDKGAIAREELVSRQNGVLTAKASLQEAEANLEKAETDLELHTVRAPINGEILRVNVRPGEFSSAGVLAEPLIIMGDTRHFNARINFDEFDISKIHQNPRAIISPKGDSLIKLQGRLVKVESYVKPKENLSGASKELVDTRILQLVFQIEQKNPPLFIGQQVDAYIESEKAKPLLATSMSQGG